MPDLRIRLLGGLDVDGLDVAALGSRKARTLLKRLALARGPVSTDVLIDALWPSGNPPANPAEQVSVLVSRLRRELGTSRITNADGAYQLHADWLDVDELIARTDEAERRAQEGGTTAARAAATAALELVRGPLLPEETDAEWAEHDRAAVGRVVARARHVAAEASLVAGLPFEAAEHAARAQAEDPYDETALRLLMRAQAAAGRRALALQAYASAADRIATDLGADPSPETRALHLELLQADDADLPPRQVVTAPEGLPGRERELAQVEAAFERVGRGGGEVVVIDGEAGIGKTRLLDAVASRLGSRAEILRSRADDVGVLPLEPVLAAIGRRLAEAPAEVRGELLGADAALLGAVLVHDPVTTSTYRDLLTAQEPAAEGTVPVLHLALVGVINRLASERPVVLLIDDLHVGDPATLRWLALAGRTGRGLLVVATRRPDGADVPSPSARLTLGRLDEAAAAEACGLDPSSDRFRQIYRRSEGHPLFLVELARSSDDALPDSIRTSVTSRTADLPTASELLGAAAVLGRSVDVDLLTEVFQRPTRDLLDDLEHGARRGLLADGPAGYVFGHELIRDALALDVPSARRKWLHAEAARTLARRRRTDPLRIAHHARIGGDAELAATALLDAADRAGARYDHDEALRHADESLSLAETAAAHLIRGRCFVLLGRYDEAHAAAIAAGDLGAGAAALEVALHAAYYAKDYPRAARLADEAVAATDDADIAATCSYLGAKALHTQGELTEAERRFRDVVTSPDRPKVQPMAAVWLGLLHLHRGEVASSDRLLRDAERARASGVLWADLHVEQIRTHSDVLAGRLADAVEGGARLAQLVANQHAHRFVGRGDVYRAWALSMLGSPSARDAMIAACDIAKSAGNAEPYCQGRLDLAAWCLDDGDVATAAECLDDVVQTLDAGPVANAWRIALRHRYLSGVLALLAGDTDAARAEAAHVVAIAEPEAIERFVVKARLLDLEARLQAGEDADLGGLASDLTALAEVARPDGWRIVARLARRTGSVELRGHARASVTRLLDGAGDHREGLARLADRLAAD